MKKSIIAGAGVAALGFAALPFAGVFAATSSSFTDTLTVGVAGGCTLQNSQDSSTPGVYTNSDREFTTDIAAGNVGYLNADATGTATTTEGTVSISCNTSDSTKSWTVAVDVTDLTNGTATITGGAATTGVAASSWAIQSNASVSSGTMTDPFETYAAAADGTFLSATADKTGTFNPSYRVYIGPNQAPGDYEGSAKYTITLPNN